MITYRNYFIEDGMIYEIPELDSPQEQFSRSEQSQYKPVWEKTAQKSNGSLFDTDSHTLAEKCRQTGDGDNLTYPVPLQSPAELGLSADTYIQSPQSYSQKELVGKGFVDKEILQQRFFSFSSPANIFKEKIK